MSGEWRESAACLGSDVDFFDGNVRATEKARKVCAKCPVADDCLDDQIDYERGSSIVIRWGIFGGATPAERIEIEEARRELDSLEARRLPRVES